MRAIKSSLDQLLTRIDAEARHVADREEQQRLAELRKEHAETISEYIQAQEWADRVDAKLEKLGIRMCNRTPHVSQKTTEDIHAKHEKHKRRFRVMRNNIIIQLGLATDEEKKFMLRNFFNEVGIVYPGLQTVLGKISPPSTYVGKLKLKK